MFLNELGLDPGIDHMSAMQIIDRAHARGGRVRSFRSVCGGLPAPESADNFLGYKLSWSPRGFLVAGLNSARWLEDGEEREVPKGHLFDAPLPVHVTPGFALECLPNRDSTAYKQTYGLVDAHTVFRGTLRYRGFSAIMRVLQAFNLFSDAPMKELQPGAPALPWVLRGAAVAFLLLTCVGFLLSLFCAETIDKHPRAGPPEGDQRHGALRGDAHAAL